MPHRPSRDLASPLRPSWREYQAGLKREAAKKRSIKIILKLSLLVLILLVGVNGVLFSLGKKTLHKEVTDGFLSSNNKNEKNIGRKSLIGKKDVRTLIESNAFANLEHKSFDFVSENLTFRVNTSIDVDFQNFLLGKIKHSKSRFIGIVVMDPETGRILSMVGFDKKDLSNNPCVDNRFPAASIFKIITAAAVVEKYGFNLGSMLSYNGKKHTLYKSQLQDRTNKYTNRITFQDSFAQSINPVFGKIGSSYLGKANLEKYALAFGFNREIDFEIQLDPSQIYLSDDPYQWAEIASGFNRETKISPVHGAMMASVIVNHGNLVEPTIVEQIVDEKGDIIYRSQPVTINQAITPETSRVVNTLMGSTIKSGTGKKAFRGYKKDQILSKLNIGGKTGSINNSSDDTRYDWFVGFAQEKEGGRKISISVVVAHEKYIGQRASYYARIAMKQYFRNYFAKNRAKSDKVKS